MKTPESTVKHHFKPSLVCKVASSFFLIIIPLIIMIAGFLITAGSDSREDRINGYNDAIKSWDDQRRTFQNIPFFFNGNMIPSNTAYSDSYWPVRDSCNKVGDPKTGCSHVEPLSYQLMEPTTDHTFNITVNDKSLFSAFAQPSITYNQTKVQMNCFDFDECREKCIEKQGHFDIITYGCVFTEYLSDVCIRVHVMNNEVGVDVPASQPFIPSKSIGCYKASNYNPLYYVNHPVDSITIEVRHAFDPFIAAEYYTDSCNLKYPHSDACFGQSRYEQKMISHVLVIISIVILVCEVIGFIIMAIICRKHHIEEKHILSHSSFSSVNTETHSDQSTPFPSIYLAPGDSYVKTSTTGLLDNISQID